MEYWKTTFKANIISIHINLNIAVIFIIYYYGRYFIVILYTSLFPPVDERSSFLNK